MDQRLGDLRCAGLEVGIGWPTLTQMYKQRAVAIRDVKRNMTTWGEVVCEVVGFYGMDPSTTSWVAAELRVL